MTVETQGPERLRVRLTDEELVEPHMVGLLRHNANLDKDDAPHYDPSRMEDNLTASIAAACCEKAVAKALDLYWSGTAWDSSQHEKYRYLPDVGKNVEVKRIRETGNPLVVRLKEVRRDFVIVSAYAHRPNFRDVDLVGWLDAQEAWDLGEPAWFDKSNKTRVVDQHKLRDIRDLEVR